jgi:hypothetical protein
MASPFKRLRDYWEQGATPHNQQQRDERVTEELKAIPQTLDTSVIDEQQRRLPPIVPARPQRHPRQRSNQPSPATQPTPPLTPELDEFREKGCRASSELLELDATEKLTPDASIYSASSLHDAETQQNEARPSPPPDNHTTIHEIQTSLQEVKLQVRQLKNERAERDQELATLRDQLHDLEDRYLLALETAAQNETALAALRAELERVREQERASRRRARELAEDLRAAMEREVQLGGVYDRLLMRAEARARRRRGSGSGRSARTEKGRRRQAKQGVGMGCFCM